MNRINKAKRFGTPTRKKIYEYWNDNSDLLGENSFGYTYPVAMRCFACGGNWRGLDRAHIIPLHLGGINTVENLHILCKGCHIESEGIKLYWPWLHNKRKNSWMSDYDHMVNKMKSCGMDLEELIQKRSNELEDFKGKIDMKKEIESILGHVFYR